MSARIRTLMAPLVTAWDRLSPRERLMLAGLGVVVAGLLLWLAMRGVEGWRDDAARRGRQAALDHATVLAAIARGDRGEAARIPAGALEAVAQETAQARGIALPAAARGPDGALTFDLESAPSAALFGWLAVLEGRGARVTGFSAVQTPDAALQARVTVAAD